MAIVFGKRSSYLSGKAWGALLLLILLLVPIASLAVLGPRIAEFGYAGMVAVLVLMAIVLSLVGMLKITVERWVSGIEGEGAIAKELGKLPDDYVVFRGIKVGTRLDADCTVVGPTGVFAIEVKSHRGRIGFNGQVLTRNGRRFQKDFLRQVTAEASGIRAIIRKGAGVDAYVEAVVVFSNKRAIVPFGGQPVRGCRVFGRDILNEALEAGSNRPLDRRKIFSIAQALAAAVSDGKKEARLERFKKQLDNG